MPNLLLDCAGKMSLSLSNFDWKLLYAIASNKIATIRKPVLRLQLFLSPKYDDGSESHNSTQEEVVMEYSKEELDQLISQLQEMKQVMDDATK